MGTKDLAVFALTSVRHSNQLTFLLGAQIHRFFTPLVVPDLGVFRNDRVAGIWKP